MIGPGFKKFAEENNFNLEKGVAYGELGGYILTFSEGAGTKTVNVAAYFADDEAKADFLSKLAQVKNKYRIQAVTAYESFIKIVFADTIGTMKLVRLFVTEWLTLNLGQAGATGGSHCVVCHEQAEMEAVYVKCDQGVGAAHGSCLDKEQKQQEQERDNGSTERNTVRGFIGALIGGIVGSIPWVIAYYFGWFVGWFGFVIGFAADKGYTLFGGKPGRAKTWIVVLVVIFCVFFSFFIGTAVTGFIMVARGELDFAYADVLPLTMWVMTDPEMIADMVPDLLLGLLFAGFGCWSVIKQVSQESRNGYPTKYVQLNGRL